MNFYTATSPAKMFEPQQQIQYIDPSSMIHSKDLMIEDQLGMHKQMNPMTTMKADFFKEEQCQYGLNNACAPGSEQ